jgi:hypothetical protein
MHYFSFRAESATDVSRFIEECGTHGAVTMLREFPDSDGLPIIDVEFASNVSLGTLIDAARRVPDGHAILQTLRACRLAENPLERDYSRR